MQAYRKDFPVPEFNGQFDKLTDRTETRSLSLPKGPSPNSIFIPSLTHPALNAVFSFRVSASVFSVFFRVRPWLILLLLLFSVFYFCFLPCFSVLIRGKSYAYSSALFPWQCFFFFSRRIHQLLICGVPFLAVYLTFSLSYKKLLRLVI